MKKTFTVLLFMASLGLFSVLVAGEVYVSPHGSDRNAGTKEAPYLTLNRAIKQAREWRRLNRPEAAGGICICLEDGVYAQSAPLFIRPEDSGTPDSPTLIRAVENAHPVISGGVAVTGWKKGCDDPRITKELRSKIWVAKAPSFGNRIVETRQMWVDGNKAQRAAQFPDGVMERMIDFNPEEQTIIIPASQIGNLLNARRLEMIVHQRWAIAILRVKSIDVRGEQAVIRFHEPESHLEFAHPWPQPVIGGEKGNSSFCLTNALELLDQPGEWFQEYPSGTIYYYPRSEEDMETAEVIVPALETLMIVDGTLERPVRHIRVEGITFAHTSWMRPSYQGHVTLQGGFPLLDAYKLHEPGLPEKAELENQAWIARPETAIRVRGTEHLTFSRCRFRHLASTGLDYEWAVSSSGIENCVFSDIGGTGILIGAFPDGGFEAHVPFIPPEERNLCTDINIKNNLITDVTNEDWGCVGIGAGYVSGIDISHNEVCHLNYSGICVGWGWTSLESGMKNNRIEANYVHHFARRLYDAGGLYTLSNQPGSVMRNNRIEHLEEASYATNDRAFYIYLDEATDGYTIENNWCPTERFDSNRPGNRNVWENNGPQVTESIKNKAGRIKPE
ncbi:right-handed parallel beta-helix repeat-containing protein [Bacteroides thetaiotaomicron]|uniref:right-handed parallel beta-helix repeat-containing protein n=1 Tax=Bacteroides thetaiotaomicron TaxID=818 RepID=UPI00232D4518|nr:right-handed parallel beta-helix repeat-containing protein [Bacteroides thetaiotaomicron]MDC2014532.1 right-handed parallel beta-helix repeat-containing protein [Bacteroides thetaiotaomicron]MDC2016419.1 right-handed parallel beta-helix repeat-containing protein [Bacteroides thetaiotaomicron]MDC2034370.1 right-handed parallel beta-helix repeat-containing protein [Bacteroides thetaiotaomicron]MDC2038680.1 right-handed parallel beta-helix repeat-containing protein [Bacteroides thetaiotaomicron